MQLLEVIEVSKRYGEAEKAVLDGVSFAMKEGEVVTIVGENGSGKSTLLKIIAGLEDADNGEVTFNGEKVTGPLYNLVAGHDDIVMLKQGIQLRPKHTIGENISMRLRGYVEDFQEARLAELLELFRLTEFEHLRPVELSGGQQQRAGLAGAMAMMPELLVLDEPFSDLDIIHNREIRETVIQEVRKEHKTIIMVTHDPKDALSLSDRILVMESGKIIQQGTPIEVYHKPSSPYAALLFGACNIFTLSEFLKAFPQLRDQLQLPAAELRVYIRPHHILIDHNNCKTKGKVRNVLFMGEYYQLEVEVNKVVLTIHSRDQYAVGTMIGLILSLNQVHFG